MLAKRSQDGAELSREADTFLAAAITEFNAKQQALTDTWRFAAFEQWAYDPDTGVLNLEFADRATLVADGQLLGTFSVADSTFEWAWSSPHFGATITKESARVKELGRRPSASRPATPRVQPMIMVKHLRWA